MKGRWIAWLPEELAWIEANATRPRAELHAAFCFRFARQDVTKANLAALCKRKGWLTGRDGRFPPGYKSPPNKGYTHPKSVATRFPKGNLPQTYRGPGHETIDPKDGYVWMIVAEKNPYTGAATRRVMKHKWLWEQANGPVPPGHALKSLDGNRQNTDPSNWIAIPRALLPRLNGKSGRAYDKADPAVKPAIMAVARLEQKVKERVKNADPR